MGRQCKSRQGGRQLRRRGSSGFTRRCRGSPARTRPGEKAEPTMIAAPSRSLSRSHLSCRTQELPRQCTCFSVPSPHCYARQVEPISKLVIRAAANFYISFFEGDEGASLDFALRTLKIVIRRCCGVFYRLPLR